MTFDIQHLYGFLGDLILIRALAQQFLYPLLFVLQEREGENAVLIAKPRKVAGEIRHTEGLSILVTLTRIDAHKDAHEENDAQHDDDLHPLDFIERFRIHLAKEQQPDDEEHGEQEEIVTEHDPARRRQLPAHESVQTKSGMLDEITIRAHEQHLPDGHTETYPHDEQHKPEFDAVIQRTSEQSVFE